MTHAQALPKIVLQQQWDAARAAFLVKEKQMTRARDALAAERRRLPMMPVENYVFEGPNGKVSRTRSACRGPRRGFLRPTTLSTMIWD